MKILWFSGNPAKFDSRQINGGWIASLQNDFMKYDNVELAIAFPFDNTITEQKVVKDNTVYYPINTNSSKLKFYRNFIPNRADKVIVDMFYQVVCDFKPDIIHVWGSELPYGLVATTTDIPVVLHIQGLMNPIYLNRFPMGFSIKDILFSNISIKKKVLLCRVDRKMRHAASRELDIFKHMKFCIGRTSWDYNSVKALNPRIRYFYCSESLRPDIANSSKWCCRKQDTIVITSIVNDALYKGCDVILRTAKILSEMNINYQWNIVGINNLNVIERLVRIRHDDLHINLLGRLGGNQVAHLLRNSSVFVHVSYIENSPNCVCEAQYIGVPVIATNAGGTSSLVKDGYSGLIIGKNDPFNLANLIVEMSINTTLCEEISKQEILTAEERHQGGKISSDLMNIYKEIINQKNESINNNSNF